MRCSQNSKASACGYVGKRHHACRQADELSVITQSVHSDMHPITAIYNKYP